MRALKIGQAVAALAVVAVLGGCAGSPEATETPSAKPSQSIAPKPAVTPAPTGDAAPASTAYDFNVPKETSDRLLALGASGELNQLDVTERGLYALYFADLLDLKGESDLYADITGRDEDRLADAPAIDNTPQEIVAFDSALARLSYTVTDPKDKMFIDRAVAQNIALSATVNSLTSQGYATAMAGLESKYARDNGMAMSARSMAVSEFAAAPLVLSASEIYPSKFTDFPAIDIQIQETSGDTGTATYEFVTFANGKSAWIQQ